MELFYLVGQISPKYPITYEWRNKIEEHFKDEPEINFINPCSNKFNKKVLDERRYAVTKDSRSFGIDLLPPKDYSFVLRSSGGVVNMNQYDPEKPLLGSFFELAWYFVNPAKAVIAFAEDPSAYICQHPFVQQAVNVWCDNEDEAAYLIEKYFINRC